VFFRFVCVSLCAFLVRVASCVSHRVERLCPAIFSAKYSTVSGCFSAKYLPESESLTEFKSGDGSRWFVYRDGALCCFPFVWGDSLIKVVNHHHLLSKIYLVGVKDSTTKISEGLSQDCCGWQKGEQAGR